MNAAQVARDAGAAEASARGPITDASVLERVAALLSNATNAGPDSRRSSKPGDVTSDASSR